MDVLGPLGEAQMADDGAVLLGQARHVEHRDAASLQVPRHAEKRPDGDDAGAPDAGDDDAVGVSDLRYFGLRQDGEGGVAAQPGALAQRAAVNGNEARAETLDAREVLVARRLVDGAFAAEFGLQGDHRDAVRRHAAVAAPLAYGRVDEDAPGRVGHQAALAPAALLGGAGLVVDQRRHAGPFAQVALKPVEVVAVMEGGARREVAAHRILVGLVADHGDALHSFRRHLVGDHGDGERAIHGLAAGHGDGVVEEDLVGDVDVGRDGGADGEQPGVIVGAVAQVYEDMVSFGERRLSDPGDALASHVGKRCCFAIHPLGHVVAADAGQGARALRDPRRRVVRAARAEIGNSDDAGARPLEGAFLLFEKGEALLDARAGVEAVDAIGDGARHAGRGQLAGGGQDPLADLVELADDARAHVRAPVVELFLELVLDDAALFLDHEHLVEAFGEAADALAL